MPRLRFKSRQGTQLIQKQTGATYLIRMWPFGHTRSKCDCSAGATKLVLRLSKVTILMLPANGSRPNTELTER